MRKQVVKFFHICWNYVCFNQCIHDYSIFVFFCVMINFCWMRVFFFFRLFDIVSRFDLYFFNSSISSWRNIVWLNRNKQVLIFFANQIAKKKKTRFAKNFRFFSCRFARFYKQHHEINFQSFAFWVARSKSENANNRYMKCSFLCTSIEIRLQIFSTLQFSNYIVFLMSNINFQNLSSFWTFYVSKFWNIFFFSRFVFNFFHFAHETLQNLRFWLTIFFYFEISWDRVENTNAYLQFQLQIVSRQIDIRLFENRH